MLENIFGNREAVFIAEIGLNHNGRFDQAREMILRAAEAGADAVKFQTFIPELMNSPYTKSLMEQGNESFTDSGVIEFLSQFTLKEDDYHKLKETALSCGVEFFSAPFDAPSVDLLERIGVRLYKIASSEVTNTMLLEKVAGTGRPVIMSTGISSGEEIGSAIATLKDNGAGEICLLHCISLYPMRNDEANLARIPALRERFGLHTGLSDHSTGYGTVTAAAILGARVFEKHFMLGHDHECPDAAVSLPPAEFKEMTVKVKEAISMLGSGQIAYSGRETATAQGARRSLFASRDISAGSIIQPGDLVALRPGTGISPCMIYSVAGKKALRNIRSGSLIRPEHFE